MAEAVAKEQECNECGAEIRPDSLFCYSCGGSLDAEVAEAEKQNASEAWLRSDISDRDGEEGKETEAKIDSKTVDRSDEKAKEENEKNEEEKENAKVEIKAKDADVKESLKKDKLKTASSIRKKPKKLGSRRVEVVWEEHENAPNVWFLVGAGVLTVVGAVLFYLAMYLK